jgi:hypothetical protein
MNDFFDQVESRLPIVVVVVVVDVSGGGEV